MKWTQQGTKAKALELQAQVWSELGPDGGFESEDFELVQRIGRISVQAAATTSDAESSTAVVAYIARYVACGLYARPPAALVKEYLPVAKSIALNELLLLHHLCGVPEDKHQAIMAGPSSEVPVVPLLGYFTSSPSEEAQLVVRQDRSMATVA
ncbi:protein kinase domain-containing protein, partial [Haematococcus lacustris]